ncbi:hypothetical protein D3C76_1506940 [compost metagenome]
MLELLTKRASVNPPIRKALGKNVLIVAPSNSGTTIIPPGIRSNVALMFIVVAPYLSNRFYEALAGTILTQIVYFSNNNLL